MWGLYGNGVPISVVVNIGPGVPNQKEVKQIARRFSWGLNLASRQQVSKRNRSPATETPAQSKRRVVPDPTDSNVASTGEDDSRPQSRVQFFQDSQSHGPSLDLAEHDPRHPIPRMTTFGSVAHRDINEKLKRLENHIEKDIRAKLKNIYPHDTPPYYRLAPETSPIGTARNDASAPGLTHDATIRYLDTPSAGVTMDEVSRRVPLDILVH